MNHIRLLPFAPTLGELTARASRADAQELFHLMNDCNAARSEISGAAAMTHEILLWLAGRDDELAIALHELAEKTLADHERRVTRLADAIHARAEALGLHIPRNRPCTKEAV